MRLVEQMIDYGDFSIGLHQVRKLFYDVVTFMPDDDEVIELTALPPRFGVVRAE